MELEFAKDALRQLATDADFTAGLSPALVKAFRKAVQIIIAATDERDIYARPAVRFEKLSRRRQHQQHSMRLNDQYRLIVELRGEAPKKVVRVIDIEDYH